MPEESEIQQKIQQRLTELPQDVQDAINASDLDDKIRTIGEKFNLHIDQAGALGDEVMLAMLGFTPLENFKQSLVEQLHLVPDQANALEREINEQIFLPIRESMKDFAEMRAASPQIPEAIPAAAITYPPTPASAVSIGLTTQAIAKPTPPPTSPELHEAEKVLSMPTVQVAPTESPPTIPTSVGSAQPTSYKDDPYREPIE